MLEAMTGLCSKVSALVLSQGDGAAGDWRVAVGHGLAVEDACTC